jgi:hypothetical protein
MGIDYDEVCEPRIFLCEPGQDEAPPIVKEDSRHPACNLRFGYSVIENEASVKKANPDAEFVDLSSTICQNALEEFQQIKQAEPWSVQHPAADPVSVSQLCKKWDAVLQSEKEPEITRNTAIAKKLMVYYVDVGNITPANIEEFVEKIKTDLLQNSKGPRIPDHVGLIVIPQRNIPSRLEIVDL